MLSSSASLELGAPARPDVTTTASPRPVRPPAARMPSVDMLRGLVMALMVLDHTRDFFGASGFNPRDVSEPALFLTRWITHLCAPVFVLLAGVAAGLRQGTTGGVRDLSRFLVTRGLWLVALEFTVVRVGWSFELGGGILFAQVIWALGMSMIALAGLVHLPRQLVMAIGVVMIAGHNLVDGIRVDGNGPVAWLWAILHQSRALEAGGASAFILYPLIPWTGVMAVGYALAPVMRLSAVRRREVLIETGVGLTMAFVILRALNLYGDPGKWRVYPDVLPTILSFVDCGKYPPSLLYLLMTLGPALVMLAAFDGVRGRAAWMLEVLGRTPLFFYVTHIYVLHALAVLAGWAAGANVAWLVDSSVRKPDAWGVSLPAVYVIALAVVALLYPLCRRVGILKAYRREWWWSYV